MNRLGEDERFMRIALEVARRGSPAPNPHVGAAIVRDGLLVEVGHHERAGQAHAERHALSLAQDRAVGATLYVTLEPCNHHGRTPPCVDAIVKAGISRVVIGCLDPNLNVAGGGAARLARLGIGVRMGVCQAEAEALIARGDGLGVCLA
jgi:diaminohydroxyphosphoribosylaminopyrimidine deaminase/5-amino-6-(5-phosphoribosylamino)uracil reductase